jgi:hypothetical protein
MYFNSIVIMFNVSKRRKKLFRSVKESKEADDDENFFESWHDMN